ncbi:MAG TPA: PP2C family protein-serine/threonine phosphatase, partial [Terracidiphilus sp.]|nr:PP2C family protein-serine/threonine phosphatase [Terracidiphilus sp.]
MSHSPLHLFRLLLAVCFVASPMLAQETHAITGLGNDAVELASGWQFHTGDNSAWASPEYNDSGWRQIDGDNTWGAQGFPSYTGYAWYRYHVTLDPVKGGPKDLALLIPLIDDCYEVYWNGLLVGKNGELPPHPEWYVAQPPQTYGLGPIRSGVLAIRVWKSPLSSTDPDTVGGFEGTPVLGTPEGIAGRKAQMDFKWMRSQQLAFSLNLLNLLVAVLSVLAWLRDRKQWIVLCMGGYTLMQVIGVVLGGFEIPFNFAVAVGVLQPVLMLQDISLWLLLLLLLRLDESPAMVRLTRWWILVFCLAFGIDGMVTSAWGRWPDAFVQIIDAATTIVFTPLETLPIVLAVVAIAQRKRLDSTRWLVAIAAIISEMIFVVRNAASQFVRFTHWTLADKIRAPLFTLYGNPISPRLAADTLLLLSIVYAVYRFSIENRRQQAALEQEFKNALEIQQVLIPEQLPAVPGFTVTSAYKPAQQVGGDFFQIIPVEGGSTLVILGDVSGKGLRAAMAVSLIVGAVRALVENDSRPAQLLTQLNRRLAGRLHGGFATCIIARINAGSECILATAGHPAPILNGHEIDLPGALPLGVSAAAVYEERTLQLQVGDHFSLYTDGLLEARSPAGEIYSFERLESLFASHPSASQATEAAVSFGQNDDITVLT